MPKENQRFYGDLYATESSSAHCGLSLIQDKVPVMWMCALAQSCTPDQGVFELASHPLSIQGHKWSCACTRALAAITHFCCASSPKQRLLSPPSSPGQRQEVSWEKRRKQKQLSLATGSDPEPWPPTSPSISLTTHTHTDKTQMCKQGGVACNLPISKKLCLAPLSRYEMFTTCNPVSR